MKKTTYELLETFEGVLVKIPLARNMKRVEEFTTDKGDVILPHWQTGKPLKGVILNVCHYGLTHEMMGRSVVAAVNVITKTVEGGRQFTMLDITATPYVEPTTQLKIPPKENVLGYSLPILNTGHVVEFREFKIAEAATA
ncbi:hypothetical protein C0584_01275 [Candidatus Parcubacteria bacterium]|nr:MAG: hypothetical protein C0584_01275 [Candidatus Parcubacteria bacterium]